MRHVGAKPSILTSNARDNYYIFTSPARIIVTNFETVVSEKERIKLFSRTRELAIIVDESAKIKNPFSNVAKVFFELSRCFKKKTILTGTPIANRPFDIWAQVYFLDEGNSLGSDFNEFKAETNLTNRLAEDEEKQEEFVEAVGSIFEKISSFSVRETKETGAISLPSKTIHNVYSFFEPLQEEMYNQIKDEMCLLIKRGDRSIYDDSSTSLKRLMRLVEIASSPALLDDSYFRESGKESTLNGLISEIVGKHEKAIIWSCFTKNIDRFAKKYSEYGAVKIHGKMSMRDRERSIDLFTRGDSQLLFATPQAAKEGLTLTAANHAIFYDRSFNLDDYLQAQDRIHRISQTKSCHIYNLIMSESIDIWIDKLLLAKRNAALLAQGDITKKEYGDIVDYSYCDMVKDILG